MNTESGAAVVNPDVLFTGVGQQLLVCPSLIGGKNYHASTYSPLTGAMYVPLHNTCMQATSNYEVWSPTTRTRSTRSGQLPPGVENAGTIEAISVETGRTLWKHEQRAVTTSLMTTASGLLFGGDANGRFRAYDQRSGEILWEVNLGSHVTGYPATFAVDGKQYIAVSTGGSGLSFALARLTPELRPGAGNRLYVFALPE